MDGCQLWLGAKPRTKLAQLWYAQQGCPGKMCVEWERALLFVEGPPPCSLAEASCSLPIPWANCHMQAGAHGLYHLQL